MADCLFCKIVKKELPSEIVYEDSEFIAFLDIYPVNLGHTLVCPKEHYPTFLETPEKVLENLVTTCKKIAKGVVRSTSADGFNLLVNNGRVAGQQIDHIHFHIMPRGAQDGQSFGLVHKRFEQPEMAKVGEAIRQALR